MKQRMNLFRRLDGRKKSHTAFPVHLLASIVVLALGLGWIGVSSYSGYMKRAAIKRNIQQEQAKLQQLRARQMGVAQTRGSAHFGADVDRNWDLVVWNLSTFTRKGIEVQRMDLNHFTDVKADKNTNVKTTIRQVVIEGHAESMVALEDWIKGLVANLKEYDFELNRQQRLTAGQFPVQFRITAKVL